MEIFLNSDHFIRTTIIKVFKIMPVRYASHKPLIWWGDHWTGDSIIFIVQTTVTVKTLMIIYKLSWVLKTLHIYGN